MTVVAMVNRGSPGFLLVPGNELMKSPMDAINSHTLKSRPDNRVLMSRSWSVSRIPGA